MLKVGAADVEGFVDGLLVSDGATLTEGAPVNGSELGWFAGIELYDGRADCVGNCDGAIEGMPLGLPDGGDDG